MARKISFKKGTPAFRKRRKVAEAIAREHPGISMASKFKIAATAVKKQRRKY